jgi:molecular chaperone GrpE
VDTPVEHADQVRKPDKAEKESPIRVVDRRWWARGESSSATAEEPPPTKPSYIEELEHRLQDSSAQLQTVLNEHRRSLEEFEQIKARMRRDTAREVERNRRALLTDLLEVVDNLERAIAAARDQRAQPSEAVDKVTRGIELVRDQFLAKLSSFGIARMDALGQTFDAARHEAVTTAPVDNPDQDGLVVAVVKDGYAIVDELLRPASVIVGKYRS